jgi:hypothetical protein
MVLSSFIEMIKQDRVESYTAKPDYDTDDEPDGYSDGVPEWDYDEDFLTPWAMSLYDDPIVNVALSAWDRLLSAIESRLPNSPPSEDGELYKADSIEKCNLRGRFIKKFLQGVRIPSNFDYVAPGLRLASSEELPNQPFKGFEPSRDRWLFDEYKYSYEWYPVLFLRADEIVPSSSGCRYAAYPWEHADTFTAGLYMYNTKNMEKPDGCRLLLPYPITANQWARFGDGSLLGKDRQYDGLYQPGFNFVQSGEVGTENTRLALLFDNWTSMIENGHWEVGENGVLGGIEKFKEADTQEKWNLYFIERTW